jgi:hypothetical protein
MRDGSVIQPDPTRLPVGLSHQVFNSYAAIHGGSNLGYFSADISVSGASPGAPACQWGAGLSEAASGAR